MVSWYHLTVAHVVRVCLRGHAGDDVTRSRDDVITIHWHTDVAAACQLKHFAGFVMCRYRLHYVFYLTSGCHRNTQRQQYDNSSSVVIDKLRQLHELGVVTRRSVTSLLMLSRHSANHSASSSSFWPPVTSVENADIMIMFRLTFTKVTSIGRLRALL